MERHEVLQQKLEHWCAASVRALANDASAHYRGHHLIVQEKPFVLQAPYLQLDFSTHDNRRLRGVADGIALRLKHSDLGLHQRLKPETIIEQLVFELLEQLRCESLAPDTLPGMRSNLRTRFVFWAEQTAASPLVENNIGLLFYTLNVVCWSRLLKHTIPEQIEDLIEATRWGFSDELRYHLRTLSKECHDQLTFSEAALAIAAQINAMIEQVSSGDEGNEDSSLDNTLRSLIKANELNLQWLDAEGSTLQKNYGVSRPEDIAFLGEAIDYKIYNRAYDKEVQAANTIRAAQLKKLRAQLDKRIRQQSVNKHRVARYLSQLVASPELSGWSFGEEEGYLDSARLARLVTLPDDRRLFRKEKHQPATDCVVSIVIDNSGSMTHHNETIAALVDTLACALELANIKSEVLGFTTTDWNGGRVFKEWVAAGKPEYPGRLNSTLHTVYKDAETPWRHARPAIAGMLKSDLFREGVDGEALQWALRRIENRPEANKIILMLSDGSPMDTATHAANSERYLDAHLSRVAYAIEQRADVKLCALGVGLDLSAYYRESMSISLHDELDTQDFFAIAELLNRAV